VTPHPDPVRRLRSLVPTMRKLVMSLRAGVDWTKPDEPAPIATVSRDGRVKPA
jgi:hypothetical protein